jgi:hypothetical protein
MGVLELLELLKSEGIPVLLYVAVEPDEDAFTTTISNHGAYCNIKRVKSIGPGLRLACDANAGPGDLPAAVAAAFAHDA